MAKLVTLFLALFMSTNALSFEWPTPQEQHARPHIDQPLPQVMHLYQNGHMCTAFVVGRNLIATAAHCVDAQGRVVLESIWGKKVEAKPLYVGELGMSNDVAILTANTGFIEPLKVAEKDPGDKADYCVFVGYAMFATQSILPCLRYGRDMFGFVFSGEARGGDSGGPLFGANGEVIGIVTRSNGVHYGAATPTQNLINAIKKAKEKLNERNAKSISCRVFGLLCSY